MNTHVQGWYTPASTTHFARRQLQLQGRYVPTLVPSLACLVQGDNEGVEAPARG